MKKKSDLRAGVSLKLLFGNTESACIEKIPDSTNGTARAEPTRSPGQTAGCPPPGPSARFCVVPLPWVRTLGGGVLRGRTGHFRAGAGRGQSSLRPACDLHTADPHRLRRQPRALSS